MTGREPARTGSIRNGDSAIMQPTISRRAAFARPASLIRLFALAALAPLLALVLAMPAAQAAEKEFQIGKIVRKDNNLGFFYVDTGCPACIPKSAAYVKGADGKTQKVKLLGYSYSNQKVYAAEPRDQELADLKIGQKVFQTCGKKVRKKGRNPCLKKK